MSDMPARTFNEADRSQRGHSQHQSTSNKWTPHTGSTSVSHPTSTTAGSKYGPHAGPVSPRTPHKRPWDASDEHSVTATRPDSAEEDELIDEISPVLHGDHGPYRSQRKDPKDGSILPSPKRSKRGAVEPSSTMRSPSASHTKGVHSRTPSPQTKSLAPAADRTEGTASTQASDRLLSLDEIDTFLDLIYKHHPEPMTAETMRKSVDSLYHEWEHYCARRQVPVRLAKKPLMDEYGKIFNGVYGPEYQAKARSIAHELSQRASNMFSGEDASTDKRAQRRDSSSRRSLTQSSPDEESEEEEDAAGEMTGDMIEASGASSLGVNKKKETESGPTEANESGSSKKSNIAQVGRNGLAVLPPGLFDILRNHLRDDILSSIMPSVRNDLTEQTRELFLQNQDLFGRIKEMEDRIRNQDLWIRHLLSRDTADMTTPPVGPHIGVSGVASGEPSMPLGAKPRPFSASMRDFAGMVRAHRHGASSSESEMGGGGPTGDYFGAAGPTSPRQAPRHDPRQFPQQGMTGPHPWEGRSPAAVADPAMGSGPGPGSASANAFGSGRWDAERPSSGIYRDRPPAERRSSYVNEPQRRSGSWQGEPQVSRGFRAHNPNSERPDLPEGRYEPAPGLPPGGPRLAFGDHRRPSTFGSGSGGSRGAAPVPPPQSTGPPPAMSGAHEDFRRPVHPRDPAMSPMSPAYDTRRPHPGPLTGHLEAYLGSSESIKPPLPARAVAGGSPEHMKKNKRGRPSKAEMANSRADSGPARRGSFSNSSHPSTQPRPYLS